MNTPILLGHVVKGKPAWLVDAKTLKGKQVVRRLASNEIWGPFESIDAAVAWATKKPSV